MLFEALGFLTLQGLGYALNTRTGKEKPNEYGLYLDGNGNYRYVKNGRRVIETYDDNGWHIIKYVGGVYDGLTAVNLDLIDANKRKKEAIERGEKYYLYWLDRGRYCKQKFGQNELYGNRYRKTDGTSGYYVKCHINYEDYQNTNASFGVRHYYGDYYMDARTYEIIESSEETLAKDTKELENYMFFEEYIIILANEQINRLKVKYKDDDYMRELMMPNNAVINLKDFSYYKYDHLNLQRGR